jgi:hypothetical protein
VRKWGRRRPVHRTVTKTVPVTRAQPPPRARAAGGGSIRYANIPTTVSRCPESSAGVGVHVRVRSPRPPRRARLRTRGATAGTTGLVRAVPAGPAKAGAAPGSQGRQPTAGLSALTDTAGWEAWCHACRVLGKRCTGRTISIGRHCQRPVLAQQSTTWTVASAVFVRQIITFVDSTLFSMLAGWTADVLVIVLMLDTVVGGPIFIGSTPDSSADLSSPPSSRGARAGKLSTMGVDLLRVLSIKRWV